MEPLILTAAFAGPDQVRFDALRVRHFPPGLNHIASHLTLFHHLPGDEAAAVDGALRVVGARTQSCVAEVTGLRSLAACRSERGAIRSPEVATELVGWSVA